VEIGVVIDLDECFERNAEALAIMTGGQWVVPAFRVVNPDEQIPFQLPTKAARKSASSGQGGALSIMELLSRGSVYESNLWWLRATVRDECASRK
jgi:hypothetical protein